jgi:acyl transferase domain-containing protein
VNSDCAFHSSQVDVLGPALLEALRLIEPQASTIPFYSTVIGDKANELTLDAAYWVRNMRQPVRFAQAIDRMCADDNDVFVEISPASDSIAGDVRAKRAASRALNATRYVRILVNAGRFGDVVHTRRRGSMGLALFARALHIAAAICLASTALLGQRIINA